ncbi:cytochrome ubiquinol oxidase subunit I [Acidibrevibacterium fodinaquatile]|uniref:cytochrome ubiquinol oxidase subunit I n=1 Tax=Acidibrevibacterium fodinaquatile TaxID=1969806 RepID=UPI000E0D4261|nr:cytochrome ubiquinol oxidase subunit I [Acidibrevibacterium fodinaquatile]
MSHLDAIFLARLQFAFVVGFHIVFPAFSIGLASYLAVLEGLWLRTGRQVFLDLFHYWSKIFAIGFAMGVVSGVVMSYQFGTNWGSFADKAGPVIGPPLGYEVLTAFFLESGFLGVMLFGMNRVGRGLHFLATCLVALGTLISAFWILVVNSWMQTPVGFTMTPDGRFLPVDWLAIIFSPSFPYRFVHMVLATYLSVAFLVGGVGAWHLLRDRANEGARVMFSMALWMALVVAPVQILAGDAHGLNTLAHQPVKVAAMEGDWFDPTGDEGDALVLFAVPDEKAAANRAEIAIPHLGSLILTHSWSGSIKGLRDFPPAERPPVAVVFYAFRIMVALGFLMAGVGLLGAFLRWRGRLYDTPWLHRIMVAMAPAGFISVLAGWTVTEVGRQPYTVYGLLRTIDSASPIAVAGVATSLLAFVIVYFLVYGAGITFLLRLMARPPLPGEGGVPKSPAHAAGLMPGPAGAIEDIPPTAAE